MTWRQMPRFYFHIEHDGNRLSDDEGSEVVNLEAARQAALRAAADITADDLRTGAERVSQRIVVANAVGEEVASVAVEAAV